MNKQGFYNEKYTLAVLNYIAIRKLGFLQICEHTSKWREVYFFSRIQTRFQYLNVNKKDEGDKIIFEM